MNAVGFLFQQIQSLPDKERQEFALLYEENKKTFKTAKTKPKRIPLTSYEDIEIKVLQALERTRENNIKKMKK